MSRPAPGTQAPEDAASEPERHAGTGIRAAAGLTVAALAGVAGAISYSHMRELAAAHGETGWHAHTATAGRRPAARWCRRFTPSRSWRTSAPSA